MASVSSSAMKIGVLEPDFTSLYREYFGFAWASLRRLGVSPATIDDAAQDLWVTVHRRLESLDPAASVKAWLFGIARRVASHYRRTEQRHRRKLDAYSVAGPRRASDPMKRGEAAMTIATFLDRLDETKRTALVLSEVEGWSAPEIARVIGTNPNTVYSRIRLARKELRRHLEETHPDLTTEACIEALRTSTEPPPDADKRCWVALAPKLGGLAGSAATAASGLLTKLKLVGLGVLLGTAGLVGVTTLVSNDLPEPETKAQSVPPTPAPIEPAPRRPRTATIPVAPGPAPSIATPQQPPTPPSPRTRVPSHHSRLPGPNVTPTRAHDDEATREMRLLTEARRRLVAGDAIGALEKLRTHAKEHSDSALSDVRDVLEVRATCARGQREHARALAERHAVDAPAATAAKLRAACP